MKRCTFRKQGSWLWLLSFLFIQASAFCASPPTYQNSFDTPESRENFTYGAHAEWVEEPGRGYCLKVTAPAAESHMIEMPIDLKPYQNQKLLLECDVKAEHVSEPPQRWFGVKFMLHYNSPADGPFYKNPDAVYGTFDWKKIAFTVQIPSDVEEGKLYLGIQNSSGTVWMDDIRISVLTRKPVRPEPVADAPAPDPGHALPRLRGVMSPCEYKEGDIQALGEEWNGNLIRWQLTTIWKPEHLKPENYDLKRYDEWLAVRFQDLDRALEDCRKYGVYLLIDLHSPPGGTYANGDIAMFYEKKFLDKYIEVWKKIATRYQDHPAVWAYDLVNEPSQGRPVAEGHPNYLQAQVMAAQAIRDIDPDRPVIISPDHSGSPEGFTYLEPVDLKNVIYQSHMYHPLDFTHQGVFGESEAKPYPGTFNGLPLNKEALRAYLAPVREFQLAYNVPIYLGEFSAIRWAPDDSAYRYLKDCIELFEEYGWDWSYHSFREWHGWNVDMGPDRENKEPTKEPGQRKKLLLEWFSKNKRPDFGSPSQPEKP